MSELHPRPQSTPNPSLNLEEPLGQVPLDSAFYIERFPIESDCYQTITKSGALIRVKAPRQMGKSSLLSRILNYGNQQGYQTAYLNFQSADSKFLSSLDQFLQWFCASLSDQLNLENKLGDYWKDDYLGSKSKSTNYLQRYLLAEISHAVVVGLDEVDQIFQYPEIATDFFALLRTWHEQGKNMPAWKKLRLAIAHSKEVYIPLHINQSPFNVGLPIELPELNELQVQDLIQRHQLNWQEAEVQQLMVILGGNPYLIRVALYEIARERLNLEQLIALAPTEEGPYYEHLRRHLLNLESDESLLTAFKQVVNCEQPIRIGSSEAFKLRSMGLVKIHGNLVEPLCNLYRDYFREHLPDHLSVTGVLARDQPPSHRILAAIVFTDVVNSTQLMVANQTQMLESLTRDFQWMRDICNRYEGQVLKSMGDGLLMYFNSAVQAVSCAQEIQKNLVRSATYLPSNQVLYHRIGIHLGDVFFSGDDVLGEGVNMAARLQGQAGMNGICISKTVYEVVKNHIPLQAEYIGLKPLKGFPEPVDLYQINP
ncbi:AAA-like domain-containing protein [Planktothrix paucivesiculata]|uniref:Adenylate/guanylate cyclase n=1 Tax=Planktothrix paucivesiculata PCC 9631 TaxID=671071 RepID=A0A7Z9DX43_9CYAN